LLRTQTEHAAARQRLISARKAVEVAKSVLNNLLDRDLHEPVKLSGKLAYRPGGADLDEATSLALARRPEIKGLTEAAAAAERAKKAAFGDYLPNVGLQATYDWEKGTMLQMVGDDWHWTVGISGQVALWDWGGRRSRLNRARHQLKEARIALDKVKKAIMLEVKEAYLTLREAREQIDATQEALASARESYRVVRNQYRQGTATNTDVLDARTALVAAEGDHYRALHDYDVALAALERATGAVNTAALAGAGE